MIQKGEEEIYDEEDWGVGGEVRMETEEGRGWGPNTGFLAQ